MAYSVLADKCESEEQLEELDARIGMTISPADEAMAALQAHQKEMGMTFTDPDAPVPPSPGADGDFPWP